MLSDKEQRAVYDEQGLVDEDSDILRQDRCWEDYWRLLFPKVPQHGSCFLNHKCCIDGFIKPDLVFLLPFSHPIDHSAGHP